jgi:hypothetical protein
MKRGIYCIGIGGACLMVALIAPQICAQNLHADPEELEFGTVYIGESKKLPVEVINDTGIATIIDLFIDKNWAGAYSLVNPPTLPYPLGPGESVDIFVRYAPPEFSFHHSELNVVPSLGNSLIVDLWGAGDFLPPCEYDPDGDQDTDGSDLAEYIKDPKGVDLIFFAFDLGRANCP